MKIKVDLDKWKNLVRLAKATGGLFDANNEPEQDKQARLEVFEEYQKFCEWRHEEPYRSGLFECPEGHDHTSDCRRNGCPCEEHEHSV
jgi:hypothetical protein